MTDKFLKEIREKISCPQFGDDHYGEWGILNVNQRRTIKRLIDYMDGQEAYIKNQQAEIEGLQKLLYSFLDTRNGDLVQITNTELEIIKKPIKAEAIKEFAELVDKDIEEKLSDSIKEQNPHLYLIHQIVKDRLKEMVGEDK